MYLQFYILYTVVNFLSDVIVTNEIQVHCDSFLQLSSVLLLQIVDDVSQVNSNRTWKIIADILIVSI